MKPIRRTVATALGVLLVALAASDVAFAVLTHAPWVPHAVSEAGFIGLGAGLLWWGSRPSAEGGPRAADGSAIEVRVPGIPDRTGPVLAVVFGSVLLLVGAFTGLLFSLVFGALRGIEAFLIPWGLVGGAAVGVGGYRLTSIALSERTRDRAVMAVARTAATSPMLAGPAPSASADTARLLSLHQDALATVRRAYESALPTLRTGVWTGVAFFLFVGVYFAWSLVSGVAYAPPFPSGVDAGIAIVAAVFIAFAGGAQSLARLRALELARVELTAGRAPAEWAVGGRIPLRILARFLRHPFSSPPAPVTEPEDSLLASSLTLLRFGRRLASRVRAWHLSIFLLIFFGGSGAALFSALILITRIYGRSPPVPLIVAAEWGPVLAFLAIAVVYLRRQFASIDEVSRRLAQLETAEVELARAFWSRF